MKKLFSFSVVIVLTSISLAQAKAVYTVVKAKPTLASVTFKYASASDYERVNYRNETAANAWDLYQDYIFNRSDIGTELYPQLRKDLKAQCDELGGVIAAKACVNIDFKEGYTGTTLGGGSEDTVETTVRTFEAKAYCRIPYAQAPLLKKVTSLFQTAENFEGCLARFNLK